MMKTYKWMALAAALVLTTATWALAQKAEPKGAAADVTFSGPYTHENLTIFLVHGKDAIAGKNFLTLQEALEQKKIVVHETSNVNELSVENVSADSEVFIQSGDIVKGGKQDRILSYDLIVSAKSGKVPIPSFCCESGRWRQRGKEEAGKFEASNENANSKDLRAAVRGVRQQDVVWSKVKEAQMKLGKNLGKSVENAQSPSSLQLTLEDKDLLEKVDKYVKEMTKATEGKKDVIGFAFVINGKVEGADIYGNAALFQKMWPRMVKGNAVDALGELDKTKKFDAATEATVKTFLADAEKGKKTEKDLTDRVQAVTQDSEKFLIIESRDKKDQSKAAVRKSYMAK